MSPTFADLGVPSDLATSLTTRGLTTAFPIQAATIPDALAGRDICGRAPTGSGKTIAFGIPLVLRTRKARPKRPQALVLVPTRELAGQVMNELVALGRPLGRTVEAVYGGVGFDRQIKALRRGVDIIVACPGRLADLLNQGQLQLSDVNMVVVDEADRMADMGFLPEVRRLLDQCPDDRQTLLFSATLDGDVDVLIRRYQQDPVRHETVADEDDEALADHLFWKVDRNERLQTAASVVDRLGPTVVFCRTKRGADRVARQLGAAGVPSAAIHGDRSQNQRENALRAFHDGRVAALVATDVAARGIHVDGVAGVVHFDPPADHKDYVHRSGRTARAGNRGTVVSLVSPELRKPVASIQKALGFPVGLDPIDIAALTRATPATVSRRERAERADRGERSERSGSSRAPQTARVERPSADRNGSHRDASNDTHRNGTSANGSHRDASNGSHELEGVSAHERAELEGKRRPSGSARRKAKRSRTPDGPGASRSGHRSAPSNGSGPKRSGPKRSGPKKRTASSSSSSRGPGGSGSNGRHRTSSPGQSPGGSKRRASGGRPGGSSSSSSGSRSGASRTR